MAFQLSMEVEGVNAILNRFRQLPRGLQKKYVQSALKSAAKPGLARLKSATPIGPTKNLRNSAGVKVEVKKSGVVTARIGYRREVKRRGKAGKRSAGVVSGYHAWWFEEGVKPRAPRGRAFKIPRESNRRYKYLKGLGGSGDAIFLAKVRGYKGRGVFKQWADAELPAIKRRLIGTLDDALQKAIAEQARRVARAKK